MPVAEAGDNDLVEPNRVYIIPPGTSQPCSKAGCSCDTSHPTSRARATPIDQFFDSMAADLGEDAIGIVLSGTGHDGALGLKAIKARGVLHLLKARTGRRPQHSGMRTAPSQQALSI